MKALFAIAILAVLPASAETVADPLRYISTPGETQLWSAQFHSETTVRRGSSVEHFAFNRAGTQKVLACAAENGRTLFAVEIDRGAGRATAWQVDGKDRLKSDAVHLKSVVPGAESDVEFLWLDNIGAGAPVPRDPGLADAVLRALDEIEVLPTGSEKTWDRSGTLGLLSWKASFERDASSVKASFTFSTPDQSGARVAFETGHSSIVVVGGHTKGLEGSAAWIVATAEGTERHDLHFTLTGGLGASVTASAASDAAADAAPMIAAQEAWSDGERDRAVELWDKAAADPQNQWAGRAKDRSTNAKRDWPMLGRAAPAWKATSWIGEAPAEGKWQLLYFWATWAPRCEGELAGLAELLKGRSRVAGAAVTRADALQSEEEIRRAASKQSIPFGVAIEDGSASLGFKIEDLPRVFLVDPDGHVRFEGRGDEKETLKTVMDRLIGE